MTVRPLQKTHSYMQKTADKTLSAAPNIKIKIRTREQSSGLNCHAGTNLDLNVLVFIRLRTML